MTWAEPVWLLGLIIPLSVILLELRRREVGRGKVPEGLKRSDGSRKAESAAPRRSIYGWLALAGLLVALARPQAGYIELPVFKKSRQVIIALDVSKSMLATDIPPSRLDRSRLMITTLLEELGQEQVGLILFAGSAFLQCPLSADYEILEDILPQVGPEYLPRGGTNYKEMLEVAGQAFGTDAKADRFLIVFSDGESLVSGWEKEAEKIVEAGVQVITLGVGTREGALVPDPEGGFAKKSDGGVVLTRLESKTLEDLARLTGGRYVNASRWVDLGALVQATIEQGKAGEVKEQSERIPLERFQIPLACALFFLFMRLWREIPVQPRLVQAAQARKEVPPAPKPQMAGASGPPPLPLLLLLLTPIAISAQPQAPPAPGAAPTPAELLAGKVAELSRKPDLGPEEFRDLAQSTIDAGSQPAASSTPSAPATPATLPKGSIEDALEAVQRGRQRDPAHANWDQMEQILRKMLEPPPESQQQQSQDQNSSSKDNQSGQQQPSEGGQNNEPSSDNQQPGQDSPPSGEEKSPESEEKDGEGENSDGEAENKPEEQNEDEENPAEGESGEDAGEQQSQPGNAPEDPTSEMGELSGEPQPPQAESAEPGEQQTVQGSSSMGEMPEGLEMDSPLRALFSRAEQIKNADQPGLLFQRMQEDTERRPTEGKDW